MASRVFVKKMIEIFYVNNVDDCIKGLSIIEVNIYEIEPPNRLESSDQERILISYEDIKINGQKTPIRIRKLPEFSIYKWRITEGKRRYHILNRLGIRKIKCQDITNIKIECK